MNKKYIVLLSTAIFLCIGIAILITALSGHKDISYTEPPLADQEEVPYRGRWNLYYDEDNRLIGREYLEPWNGGEEEKDFESMYSYDPEGNLIYYSYDEITLGKKRGYGEEYSYKYENGKLCEITIGEETYQVTYENEKILYIYDDEDRYKLKPVDYVYRADLDNKGRVKKLSYFRGDIKDIDDMELRWKEEFRYDRAGNIIQIEKTTPHLYDETPDDDEESVPLIIKEKNTYEFNKTGQIQKIGYERVVDYQYTRRKDDRYKYYTEFVYNGSEVASYSYDEDGDLMGKCVYEYDSAGKLTEVVEYGGYYTFGYPVAYDPDGILYFIYY